MELLGVAAIGARLLADPGDRLGVELAQVPRRLGEPAAERDRAGAALLQRRVVEERVGAPVQDLVRERRRLGRLAEHGPHRAGPEALEERHEPRGVGGLVEAVVERLAHDRVIGDLDRPRGGVLLAGGERGEHRGHQVVGLHALDGRRGPAAAALAQDDQRPAEVPAPPHLEHRRQEQRLREDVLRAGRREEARHLVEREALAGAEGEHDRVVAGRRLELEVEAPAEALPERQTERPVDPAAVRRVDDELHAARLVEEALEHDLALRRQRAEGALRRPEVAHDLGGDARVDPGLRFQPRRGPGSDRPPPDASRGPPADPTRRPTARRCGRAPRRARRGWTGARPGHPPPGRCRPRRAGSARTCCPAGTRRPPCSRSPSPR